MLKVDNLSVSYGKHRALEQVGIEVAAGEIVVVLGANGAGKSTLLKAIGGMISTVKSARISVDEVPVQHASMHVIVEAGIALVPEGRGVFGDLTVKENLKLGAYARRARQTEVKNYNLVISLFPLLAERSHQTVQTMSGGEQQMVAIGRAMMSNPRILMLDEPSLGLSPILTKEVFKVLTRIKSTGTGVLLVEQNARQSLAIADRGYLLENGRMIRSGAAEELNQDHSVRAAYLGG